MKNVQCSARSMLILGLMFTLGLLVGYVSHLNPDISPYMRQIYVRNSTSKLPVVSSLTQQPEVTQRLAVPAKELVEKYSKVPVLQKEYSGVVFDCVTWKPIYKYDSEAVKKSYRVLSPIQAVGETDDHRQKSFVEIYNRQTWGGREVGVLKDNINYKASGPGSALEMSQGVMALLHTLIDRLKIELDKTSITILDLPCGDLQYMSHFLKTRNDINYTGADIVPELIEKHSEKYRDNKNIRFKNIDIVKDKLNDSYDIIICRMMLQHLVHTDALKALFHFSSSNSTVLAATTFSDNNVNQEVSLGDVRFRHLNLEKPPINLSPPLCNYKEPVHKQHYMAVWKLPLMQHI